MKLAIKLITNILMTISRQNTSAKTESSLNSLFTALPAGVA